MSAMSDFQAPVWTVYQTIVEEYHIGDRLGCQTYDGAWVINGHLNGLQTNVLEAYLKALFTHCSAQMLNLYYNKVCQTLKEFIQETTIGCTSQVELLIYI